MNKIWLIIKREYLVRVRKKSFLVMTILGPLLLASIMIIPTYLANQNQEKRIIAISYENSDITNQLIDSEFINFSFIPKLEAENLKNNFFDSKFYALLENKNDTFFLTSNQQISINVKSEIESQLAQILEHHKLKEAGIDLKVLENAKTTIKLSTKIINANGMSSNSKTEIIMGIGFVSGVLVYMFIFMYGTMVMRGVIEEKTNRVIEVIISSVKPFQLMIGKIFGVALVGLTQFILWIILTIIISSLAEILFLNNNFNSDLNTHQSSVILSEISNVNQYLDFEVIFFSFLFYFIVGYLMYSALFSSIGSAVDAEADTQQFILPITIPLIISFILIQPIMENPDGPLAFWMSMIPFTSPIIMMVRIPFGVNSWEIICSMIILIFSFIFFTWIASKIYRVGILMYGKKATFKDLYKWITYKD